MNVQCEDAKTVAGKTDSFSSIVRQGSRSTMAGGVSGLLRREFRFLHKPLNIWSRLLLVAAAVTIGASLFFPLWKISATTGHWRKARSAALSTGTGMPRSTYCSNARCKS